MLRATGRRAAWRQAESTELRAGLSGCREISAWLECRRTSEHPGFVLVCSCAVILYKNLLPLLHLLLSHHSALLFQHAQKSRVEDDTVTKALSSIQMVIDAVLHRTQAIEGRSPS